jgi:formamidopyrimidine-DNA glycosylase
MVETSLSRALSTGPATQVVPPRVREPGGDTRIVWLAVPELPEVESARLVIERFALGRPIVDVDDSDMYVCRPHRPGEIRAALLGRRLMVVRRRGKSMWCETSGVGRSRRPGPILGIHLGMSGRVVFNDAGGREVDGGDYWERGRAAGDYRFSRFRLTFKAGA